MPDRTIVEQDPVSEGMDSFIDMMPMMVMMMGMMMMFMVPMMERVNSVYDSVQAQNYIGKLNSITLSADPMMRIYNVTDPYPWSYAIVKNYGPADLFLGINSPDSLITIKSGSTYTIDRLGAAERIVSIYYQSPHGTTNSFKIDYEY